MSAFENIPYYPAFDRMTPADAETAIQRLLTQAQRDIEALEQNMQPSWSGLLRPLYDACHDLYDAWNLLCHMLSVMNNEAWRATQERLQSDIVKFSLRVGQSRVFFNGFQTLQKADQTTPCLTATQRRILKKTIQATELAGVGLPPDKQLRFNQLQTQLAELTTNFSNNLLDATKNYALFLHTPAEVAGLPPTLLAITAQAAAKKEQAQATTANATTGPWKITLDTAVYLPFMMYSQNRAAREQLYRASVTRASCGKIDNTPLIEEILSARHTLAELLGYHNYAELSLATKTAKNIASVESLFTQLAEAAQTQSQQEAEDLLAFAHSQGFQEATLQPWDIMYWAEQQREHLYAYSDEVVSQYFVFPRVLDGLFKLVQRLFNIVIVPADNEAPVWHPDVRFFRVNHMDGSPCACFYLDPFSRPASKNGGAWMNDLRTLQRAREGHLILPMAVLVCNQSVAVGNTPPTMRFQEVTTLFHEFGHALQHMLTTIDEPHASGINGIEWDAVEIASQFLENWCYDHATLQSISCHVLSGEMIPDELFNKIVAAKNYRAASMLRRQLFLAATDMDLYARYPRPEWPNADAVKCLNAQRYSPTPLLPEDRSLCAFSHIFCGGYAAGYYSYKWSEVLSADIFAAFEEAGLDHHDAVCATGRRLRDTLFALGGSVDPLDVFHQFRGRPPSIQPLLRQAGLRR